MYNLFSYLLKHSTNEMYLLLTLGSTGKRCCDQSASSCHDINVRLSQPKLRMQPLAPWSQSAAVLELYLNRSQPISLWIRPKAKTHFALTYNVLGRDTGHDNIERNAGRASMTCRESECKKKTQRNKRKPVCMLVFHQIYCTLKYFQLLFNALRGWCDLICLSHVWLYLYL